jgi:hypothetical protein
MEKTNETAAIRGFRCDTALLSDMPAGGSGAQTAPACFNQWGKIRLRLRVLRNLRGRQDGVQPEQPTSDHSISLLMNPTKKAGADAPAFFYQLF